MLCAGSELKLPPPQPFRTAEVHDDCTLGNTDDWADDDDDK